MKANDFLRKIFSFGLWANLLSMLLVVVAPSCITGQIANLPTENVQEYKHFLMIMNLLEITVA